VELLLRHGVDAKSKTHDDLTILGMTSKHIICIVSLMPELNGLLPHLCITIIWLCACETGIYQMMAVGSPATTFQLLTQIFLNVGFREIGRRSSWNERGGLISGAGRPWCYISRDLLKHAAVMVCVTCGGDVQICVTTWNANTRSTRLSMRWPRRSHRSSQRTSALWHQQHLVIVAGCHHFTYLTRDFSVLDMSGTTVQWVRKKTLHILCLTA